MKFVQDIITWSRSSDGTPTRKNMVFSKAVFFSLKATHNFIAIKIQTVIITIVTSGGSIISLLEFQSGTT